ncbi:HNH endonuclease [Limobrevibacterium gyesilva]|uniref:HNH endonuclease n=1 Tax=Limobrevibacterium gyesilva TaxID=2991712 RepID=A0AA41YTQ7_9PROT|nr:HNH endonuclease [Limobrevibacterium gyesilva]MCW3476393.1 HNH endonuclease [Limobrevibacterium gyesilva]
MEMMEVGLKDRLWHAMRQDLQRFMPALGGTSLLMCCACGRLLTQEQFSLEHVISQRALADDPEEIKKKITKNERAGTLLLCRAPLKIRGKVVYANGCNSWKGKFYDRPLREILNGRAVSGQNRRLLAVHSIAVMAVAYLGMVARYGYQAVLTQSGLPMRQQFFIPGRFHRDMPIRCQIALIGVPPTGYDEEHAEFWTNPMSFEYDAGICRVGFRNVVTTLPCSRDPEVPIARHLPIKPARYTLRPDFRTAFE